MTDKPKSGPYRECTVKSRGYCCGGMCALHGVCPHEKAILETLEGGDNAQAKS